MYFNARLSIDPSQLTRIEREEPNEMFGKILHFITAGAASKKVEKETFAAVTVLQKLHRLFWDMEINNVVRLSHDDIDIYIDNEGKKDDLKEALDKYELTINDAMSHHFETINMVLEHEDSDFIYLIDININRSHAVGAYPIQLKINGLIKEFRAGITDSQEEVKNRMKERFQTQDQLNGFVNGKQMAFETMVNEMAMKVRKYIQVDDVSVKIDKRLILSKDKATTARKGSKEHYDYDPVFYGYHGFADIMLYSFLWSGLMHDHGMHVSDMTLIGDNAEVIGDIGMDGLDAGTADLFNEDLDFDARMGEFEVSDVTEPFGETDMDSDSWFDFGGDFEVGDFDF
jgi:hypothetical protein